MMLPPNKIIGSDRRYELEKVLASGAFSRVYRCHEVASGELYAAKVVSKVVADKYQMTETLHREADAMKRIGTDCPYVVQFVDAFVSAHNYYFIMGIAEGGTLLDYARKTRKAQSVASGLGSPNCSSSTILRPVAVPTDQVNRTAFYTKQLLLGLHSIHARNVVHRDIKPENLLLDKSGNRLMISDFGFACYAPDGQILHRACGTLRYCAPELLEEDPSYDGRKVDVWAAGVTVYVLLFKTHPYRASKSVTGKAEADELLSAILQTDYAVPKAVPPHVEDFLHKALHKDPAQRWSVQQLLAHPWIASVQLDHVSDDDAELSVQEAMECSHTTTHSSGEHAIAPRARSMTSLSSLAANRNRSTWDSLLEVDDGFYDASQTLQGSRGGMSDSQEYGSRSAMATHSPAAPVSPNAADADQLYVNGEWVAAGMGRVHAMDCPKGGQTQSLTVVGRISNTVHVVCLTLLNLLLFSVGRLCHVLGLTWRYPPNADEHFGAVDAAIAAQRKGAADDDSFDTVFDSLFDANFFGQALSSISDGPRLAAASAQDDNVVTPQLSSTRRPSEVVTDAHAHSVPTPPPAHRHAADGAGPLECRSSPTQQSDLNNNHADGYQDRAAQKDTPDEDIVRILGTPQNSQSPLLEDVPYSPSAPMPYSKSSRQIEDFPSTLSQDEVAVVMK